METFCVCLFALSYSDATAEISHQCCHMVHAGWICHLAEQVWRAEDKCVNDRDDQIQMSHCIQNERQRLFNLRVIY